MSALSELVLFIEIDLKLLTTVCSVFLSFNIYAHVCVCGEAGIPLFCEQSQDKPAMVLMHRVHRP